MEFTRRVEIPRAGFQKRIARNRNSFSSDLLDFSNCGHRLSSSSSSSIHPRALAAMYARAVTHVERVLLARDPVVRSRSRDLKVSPPFRIPSPRP